MIRNCLSPSARTGFVIIVLAALPLSNVQGDQTIESETPTSENTIHWTGDAWQADESVVLPSITDASEDPWTFFAEFPEPLRRIDLTLDLEEGPIALFASVPSAGWAASIEVDAEEVQIHNREGED